MGMVDVFALPIFQLNFLGLPSSVALLVAGVMAGVAPATQYRNVSRVEVVSSSDP